MKQMFSSPRSPLRYVWPFFVVLVLILAAPWAHAQTGFYRLRASVTLPGPVGGWDYLAFDPARSYLFIARRKDGVTVYDVKARKIVGQIANSSGANSTTLIAGLDRGYTSNGDGSTTIFQLSTLKTLGRTSFGKSADAGFYEPVTRQMVFSMGDDRALAFVDARTGKPLATLPMKSEKLEAAAADGQGNIFINERDRDMVARIDARTRKVTAEWPTTGCDEPTGMAYDAADARIFSGCRGDHPVLSVMDAHSGKVVATPEIGRGNDTVIYDPAGHEIYTSNGIDANIVILKQTDPDHYDLVEATATRPEARTMARDPKTGWLYLVTAEGLADPAHKINRGVAPFYPNRYFPGTFTLLTYARD